MILCDVYCEVRHSIGMYGGRGVERYRKHKAESFAHEQMMTKQQPCDEGADMRNHSHNHGNVIHEQLLWFCVTSSQIHSHTTFVGTQEFTRSLFFELCTGHSQLETARNRGDWQHSCLFQFGSFSFILSQI